MLRFMGRRQAGNFGPASLEGQGLGVAGRLSVKEEPGSVSSMSGTPPPRDDKPPTLRTRSVPPKGSKVTSGQTITVTMVARDNADRWQTGIKTIQLVADSNRGPEATGAKQQQN